MAKVDKLIRTFQQSGVAKAPGAALPMPGAADARMEEISTTVVQLQTRQQYAREIAARWGEARDRFLTIGRYLIQAKATLPHGEFEDMVRNDLPFEVGVAFQLRAVAEAVDSGKITLAELPRTYSVAYQIATLADEQLQLARARNLLRPDVPRAEVLRFKQSLKVDKAPPQPGSARTVRRLAEERRRLLFRLAEIDRELRERHHVDPEALDGGPVIDVTAETME